MKKVSFIFTLAVVGFVTSCGLLGKKDNRTKFNEPVPYNDYIIGIVNPIDQDYADIWDKDEQKDQERLIATLAASTKEGLAKLNNLQPFKKDSTFRDAAIEYVTFMDHIANEEMPEFIKIIFGDDINSEKNQDRLDELVPILDEDRPKKFQNVIDVQHMFALKFKYKIAGE